MKRNVRGIRGRELDARQLARLGLCLVFSGFTLPLAAQSGSIEPKNGFSIQGIAYGGPSAGSLLPDAMVDLSWKPELFAEFFPRPAWRFSVDLSLDNRLSLILDNAETTQQLEFQAYRAWAAIALRRSEIKAGLQHIRMGPAQVFRPLQWFDRLAPVSLIQETEGVTALTFTHFFPSPELRLWLLRGEGKTKGAEILPTLEDSWEYGGRIGWLNSLGDTGLTAHWRTLDTSPDMEAGPELRLGLDHRVDTVFGAWLEAALELREREIERGTAGGLTTIPRQMLNATLGLDYTFDLGNGLYILTEQNLQLSGAKPADYTGARGQSALLLNYPLGLLDGLQLAAIYDWYENRGQGRLAWRRTYDLITWELALTLERGFPGEASRSPSLSLSLNYDL